MKPEAAGRKDLAARLRAHVEYLSEVVGERNPVRYAELEQARLYIERTLTGAEYEIGHETYKAGGLDFRNVVTELTGQTRERVVIVGAHYDTVWGTPGADDNASGVASLLELARLLRNSAPVLTIRWAAFALEEPPYFQSQFMGSRVHARRCRERGDRIAGMLALEMLGYYCDQPRSQGFPLPLMRCFYRDRGDFIAVAGNYASRQLVRQVTRLLAEANEIPVEHIALPLVPGVGLSDNWSFWQEGYPAVMITDTAFLRNPHYHLPSDLPETLDYLRMAAVVAGLEEAVRTLSKAGPARKS